MFRRLLFSAFFLITSATCAAEIASADVAAQRQRFPLVWEAAQHGPAAAWRALAAGLESYPLYPYLEFAALKQRIGEAKREDVDKFLAAWPGTLPAQLLRENFLEELARPLRFGGVFQAPRHCRSHRHCDCSGNALRIFSS